MDNPAVVVQKPGTNENAAGNGAPPQPVMQADALYIAAKHELATGHKDAGLCLLFALRHAHTQSPTADGAIQPFKRLLDDTIALWGEGFDWD